MGMAVVAQEVVHACGVQVAAALDGNVPVEVFALRQVKLVVARGLSESKVAPVDGVGSGEIVDDSVLVGDADMAYEGQYPCEHGERAPDDAVRILSLLQVDNATHEPVAVLADNGSSPLERLREIRVLRLLGPLMRENLSRC